MSDLTAKEQRSVRTSLLFLRVRAGRAWEPGAKELHVDFVDEETVVTDQTSTGGLRKRSTTAGLDIDDDLFDVAQC